MRLGGGKRKKEHPQTRSNQYLGGEKNKEHRGEKDHDVFAGITPKKGGGDP